MSDRNELGRAIFRARKRFRINQRVAAARCNISQPVLSRFEHGIDRPDPDVIGRLAVTLDALHLLVVYCRTCPVRFVGDGVQQSSVAAMEWMVGQLRADADKLEVMCRDGNKDGFVADAVRLREALDTFLAGLG